MKKKLMSLVAIAAIGLSVWGYSENQNSVEFSDLALANVEALANGEDGGITCDRNCSTNNGQCWTREGRYCVYGGYQYQHCSC